MTFNIASLTTGKAILKPAGIRFPSRNDHASLVPLYSYLLVDPGKLVEYDILEESIGAKLVGNKSMVEVRITFQRQMEYHLMNTFLQSLLLIFVGYLSFFFHVGNFTDRIMVTLTTMLVVATIMVSIQAVRTFWQSRSAVTRQQPRSCFVPQNLPKTSYYKMIDYWLIFCLNILIVTFTFHTAIGYALEGNKEDEGSKEGLQREARARRLNRIGKVVVLGAIIAFNLVFFTVGFAHYV